MPICAPFQGMPQPARRTPEPPQPRLGGYWGAARQPLAWASRPEAFNRERPSSDDIVQMAAIIDAYAHAEGIDRFI